jgi:hypothetical protein
LGDVFYVAARKAVMQAISLDPKGQNFSNSEQDGEWLSRCGTAMLHCKV